MWVEWVELDGSDGGDGGASLDGGDGGTSSAIKIGGSVTTYAIWIENNKFKLPSNVNIVVNSTGEVKGGGVNSTRGEVSILVSGNSIYSLAQKSGTASYSCNNVLTTMTSSSPSIRIKSRYNLWGASIWIKSLNVTYGKK